MKKTLYLLAILITMISITMSSCKKDSKENDAQDLTSVEESTIASETYFETFTDLSTLSAENDGLFGVSGSGFEIKNVAAAIGNSCAIIGISPQNNTWPKTLTVDFGDGCTYENVTRKGKVIAVFTDRFKNPQAKITVTFDNFYVNNHKIEGTKVITNKGKNEAGNYNFTVEVSKLKISTTGKAFSLSSLNNIEWKEGSETRTPGDDVFSITGTAEGTNSKGKAFSITIVKPLIKKVACKFIVAGSSAITSDSGTTYTLDFGSGQCDDKATVTVAGETKEITLHK
ncbi:MAG: hypothetical protein H7096_13140 [Flavobacterium sp.]|nr:hypothetical protein [Pedobacter sp.]